MVSNKWIWPESIHTHTCYDWNNTKNCTAMGSSSSLMMKSLNRLMGLSLGDKREKDLPLKIEFKSNLATRQRKHHIWKHFRIPISTIFCRKSPLAVTLIKAGCIYISHIPDRAPAVADLAPPPAPPPAEVVSLVDREEAGGGGAVEVCMDLDNSVSPIKNFGTATAGSVFWIIRYKKII